MRSAETVFMGTASLMLLPSATVGRGAGPVTARNGDV